MKPRVWKQLLLCSGSLLLTACSEPLPLKLTNAQRARVDSLYTDLVPTLNQEMDSLCDLRFETELDVLVDSLLQERLQEEADLRKRYQAKGQENG